MSGLNRRTGFVPRARFEYSFHDDPKTMMPELRARHGQVVSVVSPVPSTEYDWAEFFPDVLYSVLFADGLIHEAWASELTPIEEETSQLGTERSER